MIPNYRFEHAVMVALEIRDILTVGRHIMLSRKVLKCCRARAPRSTAVRGPAYSRLLGFFFWFLLFLLFSVTLTCSLPT